MNTQVEQMGGDGKWEGAPAPDTPDNPLVAHLSSEVEYLRDPLDKQTQLLNDETQFSNYHRPLWERVPTPDFSPSNFTVAAGLAVEISDPNLRTAISSALGNIPPINRPLSAPRSSSNVSNRLPFNANDFNYFHHGSIKFSQHVYFGIKCVLFAPGAGQGLTYVRDCGDPRQKMGKFPTRNGEFPD